MRGIIIKSTGSWYQVLDQESGKFMKPESEANLN
jgi:hypothetical protein